MVLNAFPQRILKTLWDRCCHLCEWVMLTIYFYVQGIVVGALCPLTYIFTTASPHVKGPVSSSLLPLIRAALASTPGPLLVHLSVFPLTTPCAPEAEVVACGGTCGGHFCWYRAGSPSSFPGPMRCKQAAGEAQMLWNCLQ